LFAVLKDHSILGRLMTAKTDPDTTHGDAAFRRGLDMSLKNRGHLLRHLFGVRTLGLFDDVPADALADYLSGLLIGAEIAEAAAGDVGRPITVIGSAELASRYLNAIAHAGLQCRQSREWAAARGQYLLARAAGLLSR